MKILCLARAPLDYKGGIPEYCKNIYKDKTYEAEVYTYDLSGKLTKPLIRKQEGIKETIFPSELKFGTIAVSLRYLISIVRNKNKFTHIHTQHPDPFSAISIIIAYIFNRKINIIITWHAEAYSSYLIVAPLLILIDLILFALARKIVFYTPSHRKDSLLSKLFYVKKKIIMIPASIELPVIDIPKNKTYSIQDKKEINIISIGRLVKYKGYEYAIKSISLLKSNVKYTIVGSGPLYKNLEKQIRKYKLEERVILTGKITNEEKYKLLSNSDIFLFPSITKAEAYGLVQIEAMVYRLPIVNTFLGNGVNYLVPEDVAITCRVKKEEDICSAIGKLTNDDLFYQEMSQRSFNNLDRFNNLDEMRSKFKSLFKSLT
tara:strand:- start:265 stop:1386 length:1122 start_codon:yes stop_codon:yes gene_type:complete